MKMKNLLLVTTCLVNLTVPSFGAAEESAAAVGVSRDVTSALQEKIRGVLDPLEARIDKLNTLFSHHERPSSIIFVGPAGSGKSTLISHLGGAALTAVSDSMGRLALDGHLNDEILIGHHVSRGTLIPGFHYDGTRRVILCDCPGFGDPAGPEADLVNAASISRVLGVSGYSRIVIVMSESRIGGRAGDITPIFDQVAQVFPDRGQRNRMVSLVITGKSADLNPIRRLQALCDSSTEIAFSPEGRELLGEIVGNSSRVSYMPKPLSDGDYTADREIIWRSLLALHNVDSPKVNFSGLVSQPHIQVLLHGATREINGSVLNVLRDFSDEIQDNLDRELSNGSDIPIGRVKKRIAEFLALLEMPTTSITRDSLVEFFRNMPGLSKENKERVISKINQLQALKTISGDSIVGVDFDTASWNVSLDPIRTHLRDIESSLEEDFDRISMAGTVPLDHDRRSLFGELLDGVGYKGQDIDTAEQEQVRPFLYLYPASDPREEGLGHPYAGRYVHANDYPFSLPGVKEEPTTLRFSPSAPLGRAGHPATREVLSIIQHKVAQLIVEDGVDVSALSALSGIIGDGAGIEERRSYGIHLWGRATSAMLDSFAHVIESWSERDSLAALGHLDVALYGLEDPGMRANLMRMLNNVLRQEASHGLLTLSLRFMSLEDGELEEIARSLETSGPGGEDAHAAATGAVPSRKLERLVLSFNRLTDGVMGKEGTIARLIENTSHLPHLHVLDLRGNNLTDPRTWDLDRAIADRRTHIARRLSVATIPSIALGYNGITREARERGSVQLVHLDGIANFEEPKEFSADSAAVMRSSFSGRQEASVAALPTRVSSSWFTERPYYPGQADVALVMAHGAVRLWEAVDLSDTRLTDGSSRSWLIRHIRPHAGLREVRLDRSIGAGGDYTAEHHEFCVHLVNGLPSLERLSLVDNGLAAVANLYGYSYENLRALRYFNFAGNGLRLGGAAGAAEDPVRAFFRDQIPTLEKAENLRVINISQNDVGDDGVTLFISLLKQAPQVQYFDYSHNQFTLADAANRSQLIERIGLSNNLVLLDLSGNPLTEATQTAFVTEYKVAMDRERAKRWPVVRLNARKTDGSFTAVKYVGSYKAMARAGVILDRRPVEWGMEAKPELALALYRESEAAYVFSKVTEVQEGPLAAALPFTGADLPALGGAADAVYLNEVDALKMMYGLSFSDAEKNLRAQLQKKRRTAPGTLATAASRKQFFKTLTSREQRLRLGMEIEAGMRAPASGGGGAASAAAGGGGRFDPEAILNRALERLFR